MMPRKVSQLISIAAFVLLFALTGCSHPQGRAGWISLFDGRHTDGWNLHGRTDKNTWQVAGQVAVDPTDPQKLIITPGHGILVNGREGRTCDIYTPKKFGDVEVHVEFCIPQESNSGVYLMGNYELQICDSFGKDNITPKHCGAIYPRWFDDHSDDGHAPRVNAAKPAGEWQTFDIVFRAPRFDAAGRKTENARFVSVRYNGVLIHQNVSVNGPTCGSMDEEEKPTGPLRFQGDHGPVAYRNLKIRELYE